MEITELPIGKKFQEKFEDYFKENPLESIHLGDFAKWEGASNICAICGTKLIWSFKNHKGACIGINCGINISVLQKCEGNYDEVNIKRLIELEKKTVYKRKKEFETKQRVKELEVKYDSEIAFCHNVVKLALDDPVLKREGVVSADDDDRNEVNGGNFFYAGQGHSINDALKKVGQCNSWLSWIKQGTASEFYTNQIKELMKQTPQEIFDEEKKAVMIVLKQQMIAEHERKESLDYYENIRVLDQYVRLGKFDKEMVQSLQDYFHKYGDGKYSDKQKESIRKLCHKYRVQIAGSSVKIHHYGVCEGCKYEAEKDNEEYNTISKLNKCGQDLYCGDCANQYQGSKDFELMAYGEQD